MDQTNTVDLPPTSAHKESPVAELTNVADSQALWSNTANTLRRNLTRSRKLALLFSTLGAVSTAIASQEGGLLRHSLAVIGAVLLAFAGVIAKHFLTAPKSTNWGRARAASEALKHEAWSYAARAAPYDDPGLRDIHLNDQRERIEKDVDDLIDLTIATKAHGTAPRKNVSRTEYIERRVRHEMEHYYLPQGKANHNAANKLRWLEICLSFIVAFSAGVIGVEGKSLFAFTKIDFLAFMAVFTTVAGAITAHVEASRYEFLATTYLATARRLDSELKSVSNVEALSGADWSNFVQRCEQIIRDENSSWLAKWTKSS
jgi:SMODS and SLOG-associating 2TM effector domain 1/Protein of unknown function (DUF4231)